MNPTKANTDRLSDWIEALATETDQARHSAIFRAYVSAMTRFWRYSAANILLIIMQAPTATLVNSRKRWNQLGYAVMDAERTKGIAILCPQFTREPDPAYPHEPQKTRQVLSHFSTGYVFDVSQVEATPTAQPLDLPWTVFTGDYETLNALLMASCATLAIAVEDAAHLPNGILGFSNGTGTIVLRADLAPGNRVATLLHEVAHEVAHPRALRQDQKITREQAECQAEAICYALCHALEVPELATNSGQYLALYGITKDVLKANLEAIARHTKRILSVIQETAEAIRALPDEPAETTHAA